MNVVKEFEEHGASKIVGKEVGSAKDLAFISQIYRNPLMETFRVVYVKDDKVVGHNTISQRLPASVTFPRSIDSDIADDIINLDADTYYLMHNHPSGESTPSRADIRATVGIAEDVNIYLDKKVDFGGHVVINHREYSFIDHKGNISQHDSESLEKTYSDSEDVINHNVLGHEITGPSALADLTAKLYLQSIDKNSITYIGANGQTSKVKLLLSIPKDILTTNYNYKKVASYIRAISKTSGMGERRFAAVPDKFNEDNLKHYKKLLDDDIFTDITDVDGTSLRQRYDPNIPFRDIMKFKGKARINRTGN